MAKGNPILGYGRGAVGSIVLSRSKGQQVFKARNVKPHNAKTYPAIIHRARMSGLYKLCRYMPEGLLVGAYQDQRKNETWQSCFIRHNVKHAIAQTKKWAQNPNMPVYGDFVMSYGSIRFARHGYAHTEYEGFYGCNGIYGYFSEPLLNIGGLSEMLIRTDGLQKGDVVSFVRYKIRTFWNDLVTADVQVERKCEFDVQSFVVDPSDVRPIVVALPGYETFMYEDEDENMASWVGFRYEENWDDMLAIVVTRKEGNRVLSSTSKMKGYFATQEWLQYYESEEHLDDVAKSWGMTKEAILTYHGNV